MNVSSLKLLNLGGMCYTATDNKYTSLFNKCCWYWNNQICRAGEGGVDEYNSNLTQHTKTNSRWIRDLNVKAKIIKLLGKNLDDLYYLT